MQHALSRMAAGEPGAAGELFDVVCRPVFTLALAITGSSTAAQDVAVEAFSEIWLTCPARPAGAGSGWVFDVVCRCARSRRGRSGRPMGQDRPRLVPTA